MNHVIDEAKLSNVIDDNTAAYLKVKNPKPGNLYFLPKIHKRQGIGIHQDDQYATARVLLQN